MLKNCLSWLKNLINYKKDKVITIKSAKYNNYFAYAVTNDNTLLEKLISKKDRYFLLTSTDSQLPLSWINKEFPKLQIQYKCGKTACLIYPNKAKDALAHTLVGCGDAFYICNEKIANLGILNENNLGCIANRLYSRDYDNS